MNVVFADYFAQEGDIRTNYFECAAWYEDIALTPGEYPIEGTLQKDGSIKYLTGVSIGKVYDKEKNKGKATQWRSSLDCNFLARRLLAGEEDRIKLRPGFEARAKTLGKGYMAYGIYKKE